MAGRVLNQPVQKSGEKDVRLYHPQRDGAPPWDLGELVFCQCGSDRWNVELVGEKFTDDDGYPAQNAKYTCSGCGGRLFDTAAPAKE